MNYINIPVFDITGDRFEDLQIKLKRSKILRTKDDLVNFLIDFFEKNNKEVFEK